jgi:putative MATE family efflux protein
VVVHHVSLPRPPNPLRLLILGIGLALSRVGLIDPERVRRTTDLAWPRILTGLARMSKNAVDVAMVGLAVGPVAIAGVGFAGPYWGLAFSAGGGIAAGTIALVSQGYGAGADKQVGRAIRSSAALAVVATLPLAVVFWAFPRPLVGVLTDTPATLTAGASYLQVVALAVPFGALNLVWSRAFIGVDDAWTPMLIRSGGALANVVLNAVFIFGLGLGAVGAALGTVLSNAAVTATFVVGLSRGRLPVAGELPVSVAPSGTYVDRGTIRDLIHIGLPVVGRNGVWTVARFPMLAIVALFGPTVVAAYVIARRIWGLMGTPGWGFGLAASSLVGQELGADEETTAEAYGREIVRFSVATHLVGALAVALFAERIVLLFVGGSDPAVPVAVGFVYAAAASIGFQGVKGTVAGALDASGDTRWPFYSQALGMFGAAIPVAYLGATTALGIAGLYLSFVAEAAVPAAINYYRFSTGRWKAISRGFRPETAPGDD